MLLIGSVAIKHHVPDWRQAVDVDLVGAYEEIENLRKKKGSVVKAFYPINGGQSFYMKQSDGVIFEAEVTWEDSRAEKLVKFVESEKDTIEKEGVLVPSLDVLYMLKMSHRYKKDSPHFLKTLRDIQALEKLGCKIRPEHEEFFKGREKDTYLNKLPKLNQAKETFFDGDGIVYEWDHDSLHEAVKFLDRPAYTYYADGQVWSCMKKFEQQPEHIKLYGVLEESLVLASERSQLSFTPAPDPRWSFEYALSKVCTSITGGKFRSYAYANYDKVIALYEREGQNYMERVREGIRTGVVKRVEKK